jgi:hypothetical protein
VPEPGEWSVTEIAAHLRSCADVWGQAIEAIAVTDHPTIRAVSPTTWIKSTDYRELAFASSLQAFGGQRDQLLALLGQLPDQGWSRSATVLGGGRPLELGAFVCGSPGPSRADSLEAGGEDGEGAAGLNPAHSCLQVAAR